MAVDKTETGFRPGKNKVEVLQTLGEVQHRGRTYRVVRVRVSTGEEYISLRLYNATGKFIKQFMLPPEMSQPIGILLNWANIGIKDALLEAEAKAFDALSRYKFQMFGYWSSIWVHLNKLSGLKRENPFRELVSQARLEAQSERFANQYPHFFKD